MYLNYILFDRNYNVLDAGWQLAPDVAFTKQKLSFPAKEIDQEGYMFVYLSYDNDSPNWVYFDDFKVTHTKSNVIQYNEYYPFGLQTGESWTRADHSNKFLYNGGSELNTTSGWYETFFRGYDAALGRFNQEDPMAAALASHSPYNFGLNNPVYFNDPMGDYVEPTFPPEFTNRTLAELFSGAPGFGGGGGVDWFSGYATVERNARMMSTASFTSFYGTHDNDAKWNMGKSVGGSVSSTNFGIFAEAYNNGGSFSINGNSVDILYLMIGAGVEIYGNKDPKAGTEAGANIFYYDMIDLDVGLSVFGGERQGNSGALGDFWSGFTNSDQVTDYGMASNVVGTSGFWIDGVGASIQYSARSAKDISSAAKVAPFFKGLGVVGNLAVAGLNLAEGYSDGQMSAGDWFKVGASVAQAALVFTPVGWGILAYNGADFVIGFTTGTSITDRIANGIDNIGKR